MFWELRARTHSTSGLDFLEQVVPITKTLVHRLQSTVKDMLQASDANGIWEEVIIITWNIMCLEAAGSDS